MMRSPTPSPNVPELYVLRGSDLSRHVFHSTTADGALTFVFIGANPAGKGWTAEVKSVVKTSDDTPVPAEPEAPSIWYQGLVRS